MKPLAPRNWKLNKPLPAGDKSKPKPVRDGTVTPRVIPTSQRKRPITLAKRA